MKPATCMGVHSSLRFQVERRHMKFHEVYFSRRNRYSIGIELTSGQNYISIPVSNGIVDYDEYYVLAPTQYDELLEDPSAASEFVEACRRHEHDDCLLQRPGTNRGTPI